MLSRGEDREEGVLEGGHPVEEPRGLRAELAGQREVPAEAAEHEGAPTVVRRDAHLVGRDVLEAGQLGAAQEQAIELVTDEVHSLRSGSDQGKSAGSSHGSFAMRDCPAR